MLTASAPPPADRAARRSTRGDDAERKRNAPPHKFHNLGHEGRRTGVRPPQNPRVNRLGVANPKDYFPDTPVAPARSANDEIEDAIDARVNGRKTLETPSAPQRRVAKETVASSDPEEEIEEEREEEETPKPAKTADIPVARDSEAHEAPAAEASSSRRTTRGRKSSIEPVQEVEEAELVLSKAKNRTRTPSSSPARTTARNPNLDHTYSLHSPVRSRRATRTPPRSPSPDPDAARRSASPELVSNGPSQKSVVVENIADNDDDDEPADAGFDPGFDGGFDDGGGYDDGQEEQEAPGSPELSPSPPRKSGRKSNVTADSESPQVRRRSRGKPRRSIGSDDEALSPPPAPDPEPEPEPQDDDDEEEPGAENEGEEEDVEEQKPEPKKAARKPRVKREPVPTQPLKRKEILPSDDENEEGGRRSKRHRVEPLRFWALERKKEVKVDGKLKYEVTRANSQSPETFKRPRAQHKKRAGSVKQEKDDHPRIKIEATDSPVEAQEIEVVEWTGDAQSSALTKKKIFAPMGALDLRPVNNETYQFAKAFSEGDFCACGQMLIPGGAEKPTKNTRANAMMFVVLQGVIKATVNTTTFDAQPGDQFLVPRGNQYRLENTGKKDARLFFAHAREVESSKPAE